MKQGYLKDMKNPVSGYDNEGNKRGRTPGPGTGDIGTNSPKDSVGKYSLKNEGKTYSPGGSSKDH